MTMRRLVAWSALTCAALIGMCAVAGGQAQNPEELARRHYQLGLEFMRGGKYAEALKDFQAVVDSYPTSSVAGDALVQIATYHLDIARDIPAAQATTDLILKKYSATAAAAMGYVLNGRIAIEKGRDPSDLETAIASFERVPALFPTSDVVPASTYYAGESLKIVRQYDKALDRYREVTDRYPTSTWAARALLGAAVCLLRTGKPVEATTALQRLRNRFPGSPEAETALKWNTILYRLYVRPPSQPPYAFSGRYVGSATARFRDVVGVRVDRNENVLLAHKTSVAIFDPKGTLLRSIATDSPSALTFDTNGTPVVIRQNFMTFDGQSKTMSIGVWESEGKTRAIEEIPAAVMTRRGEWLIADKKAKAIWLFSAAGKPVRQFVAMAADRLVLDDDDTLAVLNRDDKTVSLIDREGKPAGRVPARGQGYQIDDPVDIAFDPLGHLYVLDRGTSTLLVFAPQGRLIVAFSIPEGGPGAFRKAVALGLDSAARLYVFDDKVQRVQVYQ